MDKKIYYFSGSGNSLSIAKKVSQRLGDTDLVPIAKVINDAIDFSNDTIGIVSPVFAYQLPKIVIKFLKKLKKAKSTSYIYAILTNGGTPGFALNRLKGLLKVKNYSIFTITLPTSFIPYARNTPETMKKMFIESEDAIDKALSIIQKREKHIDDHYFPFKWQIMPGLYFKFMHMQIHSMDKNFWVDDKCNGCGICYQICPVNNIVMKDSKPVWNRRCEYCMACIQWCPQTSIQIGNSTENKKRYHNPDVKLNEMLMRH